ncbi:DUF418 domain-containing protein [Halovenus marina]|uniref:DUF418 domain-containing protein n=1 Tax=Halovenus marina TaxID=3396621 RepID=UPI003F56CC19
MTSRATPTPPSDRILSLDALRGVAIFGILVINIQSFSMPTIARINPSEFGDFTGINFAVWLLSHVFVERKLITIFALLFGAGVLLFTNRKEAQGYEAVKLHYRRTFWLLVIGGIHAYLLWQGDILVVYGLCALWVVLARDWPARKLAIIGTGLLLIPFLLRLQYALTLDMHASVDFWTASPDAIQAEIEAYRGGWLSTMDERVPAAIDQHTTQFLTVIGWRYTGIMLWGMALFKWGVLSGERTRAEYRKLAVGGAVGGLALTGSGVLFLYYYDWSGGAGVAWPLFNYWGSLLLALSYTALVVLVCQHWPENALVRVSSAVGRTALSNYLFQTVVAISIFYGFGFGLFGRVSRVEQVGFVLGIWVLQTVLTILWLRTHRYGPMEWVWRKLTYGL